MAPYDTVVAEFLAALAAAEAALPAGGLSAVVARARRDEIPPAADLPSGVRYSLRGEVLTITLRSGRKVPVVVGEDGVPLWNAESILESEWSVREGRDLDHMRIAVQRAVERGEVFEVKPGWYAARRG